MQILDWIFSKRVETRKFALLFCLVLLSMPAFSVAQVRQPIAQPTSGFDTPTGDINMTGTVQSSSPLIHLVFKLWGWSARIVHRKPRPQPEQ